MGYCQISGIFCPKGSTDEKMIKTATNLKLCQIFFTFFTVRDITSSIFLLFNKSHLWPKISNHLTAIGSRKIKKNHQLQLPVKTISFPINLLCGPNSDIFITQLYISYFQYHYSSHFDFTPTQQNKKKKRHSLTISPLFFPTHSRSPHIHFLKSKFLTTLINLIL